MDAVETAIAHYGVKGMKWGVRKDKPSTDVTLKETPGRRVKATGGKRQPASEDAKKAAAARQKAKASTVDALSNQELQQLVNRMNLEQQLSRLSESRMSAGEKMARAFVADYGKAKFLQYADEAVEGNPELNLTARPKLKPVVDSIKVAMNANQGGGKKNKNK